MCFFFGAGQDNLIQFVHSDHPTLHGANDNGSGAIEAATFGKSSMVKLRCESVSFAACSFLVFSIF